MPVHTRGRGVASQFRLREVRAWLKVREAKAKAAEKAKVREAKAAEKAKVRLGRRCVVQFCGFEFRDRRS